MLASAAHAAPTFAAPQTGTVSVIFFGRVADTCGRAIDVEIPLRGCSLSQVKERLCAVLEGAAEALGARGVRAAVAQQLVLDDSVWVRPGDEVAFFSAFSGG